MDELSPKELEELQAIANSFITTVDDQIEAVDWSFAANEYYPYRDEVFKYFIHVGVMSILKDGNYALLDNDNDSLNPTYRINTLYFTQEKYAQQYKDCIFKDVDYPISIIQYIKTE